ncbi:MAG: hypothetical protein ACYTJ0_20615 [Planctomycetota bacterium]
MQLDRATRQAAWPPAVPRETRRNAIIDHFRTGLDRDTVDPLRRDAGRTADRAPARPPRPDERGAGPIPPDGPRTAPPVPESLGPRRPPAGAPGPDPDGEAPDNGGPGPAGGDDDPDGVHDGSEEDANGREPAAWCPPRWPGRPWWPYRQPWWGSPFWPADWFGDAVTAIPVDVAHRHRAAPPVPPEPWIETVVYETEHRDLPDGVLCPVPLALAWEMLGHGQPEEALDAFSCHVEVSALNGVPRVGFAIAAGQLGHHDLAVQSMRDALAIDPESLLYVPITDRLAAQIEALVADYDDIARHDRGKAIYYYDPDSDSWRRGPADADALLMIAALRFILGQDDVALYAIDIAIGLGDDDPTTLTLRSLVQSSIEARRSGGA